MNGEHAEGNAESGWTLPPALSSRLADAVRTLAKRETRLATAESCTGGLLAAAMTEIENASHIVECAFVTYSDQSKSALLGIDAATIRSKGAVSREVAEQMAEAALARSRAQLAVAITGNAGPASDGEEEGLVFVALAADGQRTVVREHHFGKVGRTMVRNRAIESAITLLEHAAAIKH